MSKANIKLSIDCNLEILVKQTSNLIGKEVFTKHFTKKEKEGGIFVFGVSEGYVISAFNHLNKHHFASAGGGLLGGCVVKSTAPAGIWAVAWTKAGVKTRLFDCGVIET